MLNLLCWPSDAYGKWMLDLLCLSDPPWKDACLISLKKRISDLPWENAYLIYHGEDACLIFHEKMFVWYSMRWYMLSLPYKHACWICYAKMHVDLLCEDSFWIYYAKMHVVCLFLMFATFAWLCWHQPFFPDMGPRWAPSHGGLWHLH